LGINIKVLLVAEEHDSSSGDEQGEVVLGCVGEGGEVDTVNFGGILGL